MQADKIIMDDAVELNKEYQGCAATKMVSNVVSHPDIDKNADPEVLESLRKFKGFGPAKRMEDELFEDYKERRKLENKIRKIYLKGTPR